MSIARSHNGRTRHLLYFSLAAWFGAIPSLAFVHLRFTPHRFCAQHLIYEDVRSAELHARRFAPIPDRAAGRGSLDENHGEGPLAHLRCGISNDLVGSSALLAPLPAPVRLCPAVRASPFQGRRGFAPILLLGLAPKHSPPLPLV